MDYISHEKQIIILKEEGRRFAAEKNKEIKGYIKIETGHNKGVMRIGIMNAEAFPGREYVYKLLFFGEKKEKTIYAILGTMQVDRNGEGETYIRFDPSSLDGKDNDLKMFSTAIIAAVSTENKKEQLHPVLKGKMSYSKERKEEKTYNGYYNEYILEGCRAIEERPELWENTVPFGKDATGARWKRIVNPSRLPLLSQEGMCAASKYRHFIFGVTDDNYYIGIPGRAMISDKPEGGRSGFALWQPIRGAEDAASEEAYGYWIAVINRNTGDIH